jgi:hypothetical protein
MLKISHLERQTYFSFFITGQIYVRHVRLILVVCEVKKAKDVKESVSFHSVTVKLCGNIQPLNSSLLVRPVCSVPFVLSVQETQAFLPQSRQFGAKVPRQVCQGSHGNIC